jgi:hypothetical protein
MAFDKFTWLASSSHIMLQGEWCQIILLPVQGISKVPSPLVINFPAMPNFANAYMAIFPVEVIYCPVITDPQPE